MIRISVYTKINDDPTKCIDCGFALPEEAEDHVEHTDWDEDRGMVTDIYEVRECPDCGQDNISFLADKPYGR